ncbi:hypothetical protein EMN47_09455 [Prolixibacteraceae bacterium JC049]|nr:hypothetical protein [Prolixibacteraceae bacterium JC049]
MKGLELTYEEKCTCSKDAFCSFVSDSTTFASEDQHYLQRVILDKKLSGILYVCTVLTGWSLVALWVDSVIIPVVIVYASFGMGAKLYALLIPVAFFLINALLKFWYIRSSLKGVVSVPDSLLAVLPYIGAAFLLRPWLSNDILLRKAVGQFLNRQKQEVIRKTTSIFRFKRP